MAQKELDAADVRPFFEQMGGEGMTKDVHGRPLRDARPFLRGSHHGSDTAFGERRAGRRSREEPGNGPIDLKILGERAEGLFRENGVPV